MTGSLVVFAGRARLTLRPLSFRERFAEFFVPRLRRERVARLRKAIEWAVANPDAEVRVLGPGGSA